MNNKGAVAALILVFFPVYFAVVSMIFQFEILDLLYLLVISGLFIRYYIVKNKKKA